MNEEYREKYICKKQVFPPVITWKTHFISSQMKIITQVFETKFELSFMPYYNSQLSTSYFQYFLNEDS